MPDTATNPQSTAQAPATTDAEHKLDDVMIAMDVVDTIRHREDLVRRELGDEAREGELIERLREIYRQQGIEVSDKVLAEGVQALKESRFSYTPPPPSLKRTLLEIWAGRRRYGTFAAIAAVLILYLLLRVHRRYPARRPNKHSSPCAIACGPPAGRTAAADR